MVDLRQLIQILESDAWCSLRFITADVKKGAGCKVIEFAKCRIASNKNIAAARKEVSRNLLGRDPEERERKVSKGWES